MVNWRNQRALVTGGASFIGSHLVDALVARGAKVRVVDNLSSGLLENIKHHASSGAIEFTESDMLDPAVTNAAMKGVNYVFHNAADHGGRGYIDLHQVNCSTNMILDGMVFRAAEKAGAEKVVFASSGCVYPENLQTNPEEELYLTENLVGPPYNSDNLYGWAKLMAEMTLRAYHKEGRLKTASVRYFTAYGPRCPESHAVMAMIARAMTDQNPFEVWGTGQQIRNWTHVSDIVEGTIRAAERIDDGTAVNVGTMERTKVVDCAKAVLAYMGKKVDLKFDPSKPTGPYNRVCDLTLCRKLLGWEPQTKFLDGLHSTIDWYVAHNDVNKLRGSLEHMLTERRHTA
ncbi:SDR family NAD(P)-dependent oxidoreductase [Bradyrhizobium symbiodeficiens]|uniref:SDR family NAD(P)-dependent oxidoreductase n=1 Tax=Bradyrhizobium symbiodeficiens TaxID=1404367 RepID=A0A6G8ZZA1_9BRAD|nr:SDR family NAD(P)-dependent oxidoreductase [Bradyrhizobium symbiodeficiens]QIP05531.1 SDR family NAD(P)-dependent oxidoreductase [Bradyrhizobium symbiodeficiens]